MFNFLLPKLIYTKNGDLVYKCNFCCSKPKIFVKEFCYESEQKAMTEKEITLRLLKNPQKNIVKIYDVTNNHINMEYLQTNYRITENNLEKYLDDIYSGIKQLHNLNIIYIDLKFDNIGYSEQDKCFKIFDFDHSGIVDNQNNKIWLYKPQSGYIFKDYNYMTECVKNLYELDDIIFNLEFVVDIKKNIKRENY